MLRSLRRIRSLLRKPLGRKEAEEALGILDMLIERESATKAGAESVKLCVLDRCRKPIPFDRQTAAATVHAEVLYCSERCSDTARKRRHRARGGAPNGESRIPQL